MTKKKGPPDDVPGNSVASARTVTEYWYGVGLDISKLEVYRNTEHHNAPVLTGLVIKCDPADEQGILIIAKGYTDDEYVVAFHRDETVTDALVGMARRLNNHTAKWKKDIYANDN